MNAIKEDDIYSELQNLQNMGFNTIILLVSWSEFEPKVGISNKDAYYKINKIISSAKQLDLKVAIRIPYLWSLEGEKIKDRIAYALLEHNDYQIYLLQFIEEFDSLVTQNHNNIILKFGSWEDFYILRNIFFSDDPIVSGIVKDAFYRETGIQPSSVTFNGEKFNNLLNWIDQKILHLAKKISSYGYEIRIDSDLFTQNGEPGRHSHNKFFDNENNSYVVSYWNPYFGALNNGETLGAEIALSSFTCTLDMIAKETSKKPFIDQLNFYDNSPGCELNAKIDEKDLSAFFNGLAPIVSHRTSGYALWTVRDYCHNIIFNPAFSEGLKGWISSEVKNIGQGIIISKGGYLSQEITRRFSMLHDKYPTLVVNIIDGSAEVELGSFEKINLLGKGRHEIRIPQMTNPIQILVKPYNVDTLKIKWIGLFGHKQIGGILNNVGDEADFATHIKLFNSALIMIKN